MDVFSALQTSVSGLKAQAFSLENISGNIANSQTVGYKRIDTDFVDMLAEQPARQQAAGGVAAFSQLTNALQGNVAATGIATNMALSGDGFFTVQTKGSDAGGAPVFSGGNLYTRRGDFSVDRDGYLVNGAGSYLVGQSLDPVTGQSTGTGPIQVSGASLPAKPTTSIAYAANLPSTPTTTSGSALLGALPGGDARVLTGTAATAPTVAASDSTAFFNSSVAGGELTAYSGNGTPVSLQMRWAKVADADATAGTGGTWNLFYANQSGSGTSSATWQNVGTAFAFNGSGQLTAPAGTSLSIPNVTVNGTSLGAVALDFGAGGLTQYGSTGGQVATTTLQQNGYASGTLNSLAVTNDGKVTGTYSNGNSVALAQVGVARFNAPNALKAVSAGNYAQTAESGGPLTGLAGTTIIGGNVEQSNTDTAGEFSKLIVTQQAYSANTRVMSTAQQMMSDLINVIR
ncbi:flagellar hook protein FlgE [Methylobacterium platani]|uniref:Flagellar hook protein FlgE n=2 Tax=Methylobacterium platani TaxID=427683 RepID=A0A179SGZ9_9HYPH|nr:flagellar hook-basal body complex protein [Methylobacterium platani]KMO17712.1 flagellar hook protein FlgE [Methylobacterium platani JCM 14648]OAS27156.1 flagellar biosynthesis protein FlgE [Methylobacterium platani]